MRAKKWPCRMEWVKNRLQEPSSLYSMYLCEPVLEAMNLYNVQ